MHSSQEYIYVKTATGTLLLGGDISKSWQAFLSGTIKNVYNVPENPEIESKVESDFDAFECIDLENYLLKEEEQDLQLACNNFDNVSLDILQDNTHNTTFNLNSSSSTLEQTELTNFTVNSSNKDKIYGKIIEKTKSKNKFIQNFDEKQITSEDQLLSSEKQ